MLKMEMKHRIILAIVSIFLIWLFNQNGALIEKKRREIRNVVPQDVNYFLENESFDFQKILPDDWDFICIGEGGGYSHETGEDVANKVLKIDTSDFNISDRTFFGEETGLIFVSKKYKNLISLNVRYSLKREPGKRNATCVPYTAARLERKSKDGLIVLLIEKEEGE